MPCEVHSVCLILSNTKAGVQCCRLQMLQGVHEAGVHVRGGHTCCMNWPIHELGSEPFWDTDRAGLPRRSPEAISVGHAAMACCSKHKQCISHTDAMTRQTLLSHRHEAPEALSVGRLNEARCRHSPHTVWKLTKHDRQACPKLQLALHAKARSAPAHLWTGQVLWPVWCKLHAS